MIFVNDSIITVHEFCAHLCCKVISRVLTCGDTTPSLMSLQHSLRRAYCIRLSTNPGISLKIFFFLNCLSSLLLRPPAAQISGLRTFLVRRLYSKMVLRIKEQVRTLASFRKFFFFLKLILKTWFARHIFGKVCRRRLKGSASQS